MTSQSVVILGAGVIGLCCALNLQEKGFKVTLIDRLDPGEATSYGNAGVISPWSCVPQCMPGLFWQIPFWLINPQGPISFRWRDLPSTIPWALQFLLNSRQSKVEKISDAMAELMRDNIAIYQRFLNGSGGENLLKDSWYINVFKDNQNPSLDDLAWRLRIDHGAPVELVKGGVIRDIEPEISSDYHTAILIKDQARTLSPGDLCKALAAKVKKQGATFLKYNIKALEKRADTGVDLISSQDERIKADKLVLASGIWSVDLLKPLGFNFPLMSERGYHLEFQNPDLELRHSIADVQGRFVVSSMTSGVRAAGTAEFAHHDAPAKMKRSTMLIPLSKKLLPRLNIEETKSWMGIRPSFPDNLPVIGELPGLKGVFSAFGHSHYGMSMAPVTGRLITQMLEGSKTNKDGTAYSPERFL